HGRRRLLIFLRFELFAQACRRVGQYRRGDGDVNELPGGTGKQRPIADGKEAKTEVSELLAPNDRLRCQTNDGVVTVAAGKFLEEMRGILSRHRHFDCHQQLLRRKRGLIDAGEEFAGRDSSLTAWPTNDN